MISPLRGDRSHSLESLCSVFPELSLVPGPSAMRQNRSKQGVSSPGPYLASVQYGLLSAGTSALVDLLPWLLLLSS